MHSGLAFWTGIAIANDAGPSVLLQGSAGYATGIQILGRGTPNEGFMGSPEFQGLFANQRSLIWCLRGWARQRWQERSGSRLSGLSRSRLPFFFQRANGLCSFRFFRIFSRCWEGSWKEILEVWFQAYSATLGREANTGHPQSFGRLEHLVKCVSIWLAVSPAPQRQPQGICRPGGRSRLASRLPAVHSGPPARGRRRRVAHREFNARGRAAGFRGGSPRTSSVS